MGIVGWHRAADGRRCKLRMKQGRIAADSDGLGRGGVAIASRHPMRDCDVMSMIGQRPATSAGSRLSAEGLVRTHVATYNVLGILQMSSAVV
jgi:hypothetical protein